VRATHEGSRQWGTGGRGDWESGGLGVRRGSGGLGDQRGGSDPAYRGRHANRPRNCFSEVWCIPNPIRAICHPPRRAGRTANAARRRGQTASSSSRVETLDPGTQTDAPKHRRTVPQQRIIHPCWGAEASQFASDPPPKSPPRKISGPRNRELPWSVAHRPWGTCREISRARVSTSAASSIGGGGRVQGWGLANGAADRRASVFGATLGNGRLSTKHEHGTVISTVVISGRHRLLTSPPAAPHCAVAVSLAVAEQALGSRPSLGSHIPVPIPHSPSPFTLHPQVPSLMSHVPIPTSQLPTPNSQLLIPRSPFPPRHPLPAAGSTPQSLSQVNTAPRTTYIDGRSASQLHRATTASSSDPPDPSPPKLQPSPSSPGSCLSTPTFIPLQSRPDHGPMHLPHITPHPDHPALKHAPIRESPPPPSAALP
jgi:hypothetical protein